MLSLSLADVNCLVIRMCDICHKDVRQMPKTFATIVTQPFDICRTTVRHMPKHPRSEVLGQTHQNDCSHKARFSQRECEVVTTFLSRCCVPAAPFLDRAGMSGVFLLTNGNHCFHLFFDTTVASCLPCFLYPPLNHVLCLILHCLLLN